MPKLSPNLTKNGHFWSEITELFSNFFVKILPVSEKARKTRLDSKFEKSQFPKLAKTKISAKTVFRRALIFYDLRFNLVSFLHAYNSFSTKIKIFGRGSQNLLNLHKKGKNGVNFDFFSEEEFFSLGKRNQICEHEIIRIFPS